jgi:hypothetical protein
VDTGSQTSIHSNGLPSSAPYSRRASADNQETSAVPSALTPAQAYQVSAGYGRTVSNSSSSATAVPSTSRDGSTLRPVEPLASSRSQKSHGRTVDADEDDGYVSPPPTYTSHDAYADGQAQQGPSRSREDSSTPPQLPDIVADPKGLSFLDDLENLGIGSPSRDASWYERRQNHGGQFTTGDRGPSTSHSSGSLTSQRHYEDEMRGA